MLHISNIHTLRIMEISFSFRNFNDTNKLSNIIIHSLWQRYGQYLLGILQPTSEHGPQTGGGCNPNASLLQSCSSRRCDKRFIKMSAICFSEDIYLATRTLAPFFLEWNGNWYQHASCESEVQARWKIARIKYCHSIIWVVERNKLQYPPRCM